jgi:hypothetical protein
MTNIHDDEWFKSLPHGARALFNILITSVGTSGARTASIDWMVRQTGYNKSGVPMWLARILIRRQLKQLSKKIRYWPVEEVVWVVNFVKHQGSGQKFLAGAVKHTGNFPEHIATEIRQYISPPTNTVSDTLSDTVSDTHAQGSAHTTEEQTNRGTDETEESIHLYTEQYTDAQKLIMEYLRLCPSGLHISPDIDNSTIIEKITKALATHPLEFWSAIFARAEASDYLAGKVKGGDQKYFKIKFGWIIQLDVAARIADGLYDNHESKGNRLNRTPSSDWKAPKVANA